MLLMEDIIKQMHWSQFILGCLVILVTGLISLYGNRLTAESLSNPHRRHRANIIIASLFVATLFFGLLQQYEILRAENNARHATEEALTEARAEKQKNDNFRQVMNARIEQLLSQHTTAPNNVKIEAKISETGRRQQILSALRQQYILSHDNISAGLLAGTEQPPPEWMNERLHQLGEKWTVGEPDEKLVREAQVLAARISQDCEIPELLEAVRRSPNADDNSAQQTTNSSDTKSPRVTDEKILRMLKCSPEEAQAAKIRASLIARLPRNCPAPEAVTLGRFHLIAEELRALAVAVNQGTCYDIKKTAIGKILPQPTQ